MGTCEQGKCERTIGGIIHTDECFESIMQAMIDLYDSPRYVMADDVYGMKETL